MVGFSDAIRLGLSRFLELGGRSTRAEFWWWWLVLGAITTVLEDTPLAFPVVAALIVPSVTVLVRRLHDTGRSGWTAWVFLIPAVGLIILLFLLAQPSDPASNRFGPPPVHGTPWPQGAAPAPPSAGHDPGDDGDVPPRASGWDDLPPPAPPAAR